MSMSVKKPATELSAAQQGEFLTVEVAGQMFGIPVLQVSDVLGPQRITRVPLAPPQVAGSLNLRGRIVTAIDVRARLGLARAADEKAKLSVVVENGGELYSLLVDNVGEVLSLPLDEFERNPPTLDPAWRDLSTGIFRLEGRLLLIVDVKRMLAFETQAAA
jgi:purine-binding chemotaxis protein CheW